MEKKRKVFAIDTPSANEPAVTMTRKEVLEKALQKARNQGSRTARQYLTRMGENPKADWSPDTILVMVCLSHDFAKAFWGEQKIVLKDTQGNSYLVHEGSTKNWQFHLQQMVIAEDRYEYLMKFL